MGLYSKNSNLGFARVWGPILIGDTIKRIAQKLRRIILLHIGLVTFRIHYWKTRKPVIFMDVTMTPQTNYS